MYTCESCKMAIEDLVCAKCHQKLEHKTIEKNGEKINVSICPNDCGKIKSPQCCGHDMKKS